MIIKKFEDQVERFYNRPAVKTAERELTYGQLNAYANQVAHAIVSNSKDILEAASDKKQQVALLFEHGVDMIVGTIGILKANKSYVPLDISDPEKRLVYLLEDSESYMILTDNQNLPLAQILSHQARKKPTVLNIESIGDEFPGAAIERETSEERTAYILYTSGSTGRPKGVYQTHRNMWYYTWNWIERFSITESDRMSLFTAFTHDGAVQDTFAALLSGACLYPFSMKESTGVEELYMLLVKEEITIWHSVPSLYRYFSNTLTEKDMFYNIRWVLLGGEPLREHDLYLFKSYFPNAQLANVYGQTESSVSTICTISQEDTFDDISLGKPLDETEILLVDEDGNIVETMGIGEIVVSCDYLAPGYWKNKESSEQVFTHDDELGRLYWTGDLGRLTAEGTIKMMGRKDFQIKIRGFRVEIGEIESVLLQHNAIKEGVTIAKENESGDNYLCVYIVSEKTILPEELREYLSSELPDYMIPRYFIFLEKMPVTSTGKIDRNRLPEPEEVIDLEATYVAPTNETEKKLAVIWQEILSVEKVGINNNFIELGGHSLLVISIISKVHEVFNVELQLRDVFEHPTVKELSQVIMRSKQMIFSSIEPMEKKEYYVTTASQKRMFVLNQYEGIETTYNLPGILKIEGKLDRQRFEQTFKKVIKRHETLRTSLRSMGNEIVQIIHENVDFQIHYIDMDMESNGQKSKEKIETITNNLIQPFDLSQAPLLHAGLVKTSDSSYLLMLDMHHIISDGISWGIFIKDFMAHYLGEDLPPLKIQYKNFSEWQKKEIESGAIKQQETFWLKQFEGELPVLNMPTDYQRPAIQSFEGRTLSFNIGTKETKALKKIALEEGATLFMVILAICNIMLSKICSQEDIIVGTDASGRKFPDLERVIGIFVNTLALRNFPAQGKVFKAFLKEVKERTLDAFENQDYPFEDLVEQVSVNRDVSRNPIFDVIFSFMDNSDDISSEIPTQEGAELKIETYGHTSRTAMFDFSFNGMEKKDRLFFYFNYCTKLFRKETIERFIAYFREIVSSVIKNPDSRIWEIEMVSDEEERRLLESINKEEVKEFIKDIEGNQDSLGSSEAEFDF